MKITTKLLINIAIQVMITVGAVVTKKEDIIVLLSAINSVFAIVFLLDEKYSKIGDR